MRSSSVARRLFSLAIASTSAALPAGAALAQSGAALEEIIVNARREAENVQEVPVSMKVLNAEAIQNMAMTNPTELSKLAPGLNLKLENPTTPVIILRGVRWTQASGTPAIPIYLNEISFDPVRVLQTMFDVDRVEVLRGPQGTSRGAPSISGAVTMSSRQADLNEAGGYVSGLFGENEHGNLQGAYGMPLIEGKLGVRVAGNIDHSEGDGVDSVSSKYDPEVETRTARISTTFEPIETLTFDLMFQRMDQKADTFTQLEGPGSAGNPLLGLPANFNGPAISRDDRRGNQELPNKGDFRTDLITLNANWEVLGHALSYNFGSQVNEDRGINGTAVDVGNLVSGYDATNRTGTVGTSEFFVHEVRFSSLRTGDTLFDYDVGFYSQRTDGKLTYDTVGFFLPGAFGSPSAAPSPIANPAALDRHTLTAHSDIHLQTDNYSVYGNLAIHLSDDTELALGLREIHDERPSSIATTTSASYAAFANPTPIPAFGIPALPCNSLGFLDPALVGAQDSPLYPGACESAVPAGTLPYESYSKKEKALIYNASLSHMFTPDLLGYVTVGTSWRVGLPAINNPGLPSNMLFPAPEEATSYEIGVKSTWLQSLRVNADIFQIDYDGQLTQFQEYPYYNSITGQQDATSQAFFRNVDAQVRGIEIEIAARPLDDLTLGADISYAKIESEGGQVPCFDDGQGPLSPTHPIYLCTQESGIELNASPKLQASLNGDYVVPMESFDGYVRWVANYQDESENYGTSIESTPSYTTVDLFLGVRDPESAWDVGIYGKNIFDKEVVLTRNAVTTQGGLASYFGAPGYEKIVMNAQREIGLSARYSFGSR